MKKLISLAHLLFFLSIFSFFETSLLGMKRKRADQGKSNTNKKYKYPCSVDGCNKGYDKPSLLNNHKINNHSQCPWNTECNKKEKFDSLVTLYTHIEQEHSSKFFYSCDKCKKFLSMEKHRYENHYKNCTPFTDNSVECCGKKFSPKQVIEHKIKDHYCCPWSSECKNAQPHNSLEELYNHITTVHKSIFICSICKTFTTQELLILNTHRNLCTKNNFVESPKNTLCDLKIKSNLREFHCPNENCSKEFACDFLLDLHQIKDHLYCPWCTDNHTHESVKKLHDHIIEVHQNIEYYYRNLCEKYNLEQASYFEPIQKKRTHCSKPSSLRPFKLFFCPGKSCSKNFTTFFKRTHHQMNKHKMCPWCIDNCQQSSIQTLYEHIKAHHPKKQSFFCNICSDYISQDSHRFKKHLISCESLTNNNLSKPISCPDKNCFKKFKSNSSRIYHQMNQHTMCPWCIDNSQQSSIQRLYEHIGAHHPEKKYFFCDICRNHIAQYPQNFKRHLILCRYKCTESTFLENPQNTHCDLQIASKHLAKNVILKKFHCPDENCFMKFTCDFLVDLHQIKDHNWCPWCTEKHAYESVQKLHNHIIEAHQNIEYYYRNLCEKYNLEQASYFEPIQKKRTLCSKSSSLSLTNNNSLECTMNEYELFTQLTFNDFSFFDEFDESLEELLFATDLSKIKAGIINESGTDCFMNASLQVLNNIQSLIDVLNSTHPLAGTLTNFFTKLRSEKIAQTGSMELRNNITTMTNNYTLSTMQFGQHDAQEFISSLLDELNTENDKVQDAFKMELQSSTICNKGEHAGERIDLAWLLPLDLPIQLSPIRLQALIDNFNKQETIKDFHCNACNLYGIQRTISFKKLPKIFVASTKRFTYIDGTWQRINTPVNIEEDLILSDETGAVRYKLRGVILHHLANDNVTNLGHYTAQVKDYDNGLWYYYDDSYCREISLEEVIGKSSQAYIYFYEQVLSDQQQEVSMNELILN